MQIVLALISHTNVGKTTLARTLLARDIGEVRDAPHVTELIDEQLLLRDETTGDELILADSPGFGDSRRLERLLRRMQHESSPIGWFLSQLWDRWRDRAFWGDQQALRLARERGDVVLYLANASEDDAALSYIEPEMALLAWIGRPVLVLLNQLGAPREPAAESAEVERWKLRLARWPLVRQALPLDAFARCWVQEGTLLDAVQALLPANKQGAMHGLALRWWRGRQAVFERSMQALSASLLKTLVQRASLAAEADADAARRALLDGARQLAEASTTELLALHGLEGQARDRILERVAHQVELHPRLHEGKAALWGGVLSGALLGLKADIASGGLTLGGGMLAGGLLGALGAAGLVKGANRLRGTEQGWAGWPAPALRVLAHAALLRYLAVAHYGRGRGDYQDSEAPAFWSAWVDDALAPQEAQLLAIANRALEGAPDEADLNVLLAVTARRLLERLYGPWPLASGAE